MRNIPLSMFLEVTLHTGSFREAHWINHLTDALCELCSTTPPTSPARGKAQERLLIRTIFFPCSTGTILLQVLPSTSMSFKLRGITSARKLYLSKKTTWAKFSALDAVCTVLTLTVIWYIIVTLTDGGVESQDVSSAERKIVNHDACKVPWEDSRS